MAIVQFIKRVGDFQVGDFIAPISRFLKYPIILSVLLTRIRNLGAKYNISLNLQVFRINTQGIAKAKAALKGKGGIYVWYCHATGFFYLGSAQVFFGKDARLSNYLMASRLNGGTYISRDIAKDLLKYGYSEFSLIIIECFDVGIDKQILLAQEQLWIMLYPTYNRSLKVGSNEGQPIPETKRRSMSTVVYVYEVQDGAIVSGSEQVHYGIKQLARNGISSIFHRGITKISNFEISPLIKTGALYKQRFLITTERIEGDKLTNWRVKVPNLVSTEVTRGKDTRIAGVYVYKYVNVDHTYTKSDFVEFVPTITACSKQYNISKTQLQRVRKYGSMFNGYRFSNYKLHSDE